MGGTVDTSQLGVIPLGVFALSLLALGATPFGLTPFGLGPFVDVKPIGTVPFVTTATPFGATPLDAAFPTFLDVSLLVGFPFTLSFEFSDPLESEAAVKSEVEAGKKRPIFRGDVGSGGRAPRKDDDDDKSDDDDDNEERDEEGGNVRYRGAADFPPE